tara:strand:- start:987 stop:1463 length:477 start_codon:yes stop_codon:yes gene_type:complete
MPLQTAAFTDEEFAQWRDRSIATYAAEKIAVGTWSADQAVECSRQSFDSLLPAGLATPDHVIRRVNGTETGELIGWFWVGPASSESAPDTGWLYDIEVLPAHRGNHYGKLFMAFAEAEARQLGFTKLGLHVFAPNPIARRLYESCGYAITDYSYAKIL